MAGLKISQVFILVFSPLLKIPLCPGADSKAPDNEKQVTSNGKLATCFLLGLTGSLRD
jgi:hypothetical protein